MKKLPWLLGTWNRLTLRRKLMVWVGCVVGLMICSGVASVTVVSLATHSMQAILQDNQTSYDLQQAVVNESRAFLSLIRDPSQENKTAYAQSAASTANCVAELPADYGQIGEKRFELTWTIQNSYREYRIRRDALLSMPPEDSGYVAALYDVYAMQDYLKQYSENLTEAVLQQGSISYTTDSAFFISIPYLVFGITLLPLAFLLLAFSTTFRAVFRTMADLAEASRKIERNDFTAPDLEWSGEDEMGGMVRAFNKMKHANEQYVHAAEDNRRMQERLHGQELEQMQLEKRFADAQFQVLKNQLHPHFLFNTLNTIARMAKLENAPTSERMTLAVSNLLRYNLRTTDPLVPLAQELKVVRDYLYIQQMRFDERLRWRMDCRVDAEQTLVPVYLLQPLVENAVLHGIVGKEKGGAICVCIRADAGMLKISVTDTGVGIPPEHLQEIRRQIASGETRHGIGLGNLQYRLAGYYAHGGVCVYSKAGCGTAVLLAFGGLKQEMKEDMETAHGEAAECITS